MSNGTAKLPPEVWHLVLTSPKLRRRDVNALSLVSKGLLQSCRPKLYERLYLRDSRPYVEETMDLLKKDTGIAGEVRELEVMTSKADSETWIDIDIFVSLKRLHKLVFRGWPFRSGVEQDEFAAIVSEHCKSLHVLICDGIPKVTPLTSVFPVQRLRIPGLESIWWSDAGCFDESLSPALDLIRASLPTLIDISFPSVVEVEEQTSFFSFTFPKLRSLSLGPWFKSGLDDPLPTDALAAFLGRHPSLESLSLGWDTDGDESVVLRGLPATACPSLKHLHANITVLTELLNTRVGFLETLETLSTGHGAFTYWDDDYSDFNDALAGYGPLRGVKSLSINWGTPMWDDDSVIDEYTIRYAQSFPSVERWSGDIPRENPVHVFSFYPRLKKIEHTYGLTFDSFDGGTPKEYVHELAVKLPELEEVVLSTSVEGRVAVFRVDRRDEAINVRVLDEYYKGER